jgi:hypothetical protein
MTGTGLAPTGSNETGMTVTELAPTGPNGSDTMTTTMSCYVGSGIANNNQERLKDECSAKQEHK